MFYLVFARDLLRRTRRLVRDFCGGSTAAVVWKAGQQKHRSCVTRLKVLTKIEIEECAAGGPVGGR